MHPVLDRDKFHNCEDLIDALEECHKSPFLEKMFGKCTIIKQDLSDCLHHARLAADREKILERREKNKRIQEKLKKAEENEWGKDGYLKQVAEREYQLRKAEEQKAQSSANHA
ncbi:unnamed protein product [Ambrosiozyma monospora]|uniref:Unnamed protein product n=1 Tax=Ambrosiozyma monospora TaxID=43982 RepID=A0ACB5SS88_AMBMO|nr:unnamed protein product [Ambrosiozyma monospora]